MAIATCIEKPTIIVRRTVALDAAIPKGTVLQISSSPNTVTASSGDNEKFGGIAVEEKVATETDVLSIGVALDGTWQMTCTDAAITAGQMVNLTAANSVAAAVDADFENRSLVGRAEQTKDANLSIRVRLMGY